MAERVNKVRLEADVSSYISGMEQAQKHTRQLETAAEELARNGQAFTQFGQAMVVAGAALTGGTALAAKAAVDWESAWAGVTKTVDGTPEQMAAVEDGLRGLTAVLPASHDEIAAVAEAAGQLGIKTGSIVDFTETMINLGETTNLSAEEAATSLARFMNVMGTSQDDVDRLGSSLVELGNNYATTEREIMEMATRLSGAGDQIGLSEGQTLGLAAALSSVGIEAEAGGSAMSKVMIDIASSVDKGGERLDKFADIAGVSAEEFARKWEKDPGEALALFVSGLSDMESQGKSTFGALEDLGITEVRMRDALLRASSASDDFTKAMKNGEDAFKDNNALQDEAAKRYETTAAKIDIAKNAVVDAAIGFGEVFLPAISGVAEVVTDVAQAFGGLPAPIKGTVSSVTALAGVVTLGGGAFLMALPKIAEYRAALITLSTSSIPGVSAAALGMLNGTRKAAAGMASLAKFMVGPWGVATAAAVVGVKLLTDYLESLQATSEEMQNALSTASSAAEILGTAGQGMDTKWLRDVGSDLENVSGMLDKVMSQDTNWWERFTTETMGFRDSISKIGTELGDLAGSDLPAAQEAFGLLADKTDGSQEQLMKLLDMMPDYKQALLDAATANGVQVEGLSDAEKAQVLLNLAQGDGVSSAEKNSKAMDRMAGKAEDASDSVEGLADSIRDFGSAQLDMRAANRAVEESYDDLTASIEENGTSLDVTTEAGRANESAIDDFAKSALEAAAATYEQTGSIEEASKVLSTQRARLIDTLTAMGMTKDEAVAYADKLGLIPSNIKTTVSTTIDAAQKVIDGFIYFNDGRRIKIHVDAVGNQSWKDGSKWVDSGASNLNGGMYSYANGGFGEGIYSGTSAPLYKFAEPELPWEAFISGRPGQEQRNAGIAYEALARLGALPQPQVIMAGGGGQSGSAPLIQGDVNISSRTVSGALNDLNFELRKRARGGR